VTRPPPARRRRPVPFRPRGTLALLWLAGLFMVYALAFVSPALYEVWRDMPPGVDQQARAEEVAREAAGPRLYWAFGAALATVALGAWRKALPGLRE